MIFNQLNQSLEKTLQSYSRLNDSLASGKRLLAPSDDPNGIARAIDYTLGINANNQFKTNIDAASTSLNVTNTTLTLAEKTLSDIQSLINAASSGQQDPLNSASNAKLAGSFRDMLYDLANTKMTNNQYLFGGFRSDTQPYAAGTYDYQGDSGIVRVPIDSGATLPVNVTGNATFSYTLAAPISQQIGNGNFVHYTPGAGTTVDVEIRDATDTTVLDTFSFSNAIQMTDLLSTAIGSNDTSRMQALIQPFAQVQEQLRTTMADVGTRVFRLDAQSTWLTNNTNSLTNSLSTIVDADPVRTVAQLKQTEVTLQALRDSASRVLSQSLFDFLK
ncbi:MAG: flagellar hook-associated protein FlgL [Nitrospirae bacterium]|nr:flagellar hook-associated protein FlgL [Nitrospirota bacterium]NTW65651.1 flagellar hook-associated protein FlgL [Nitrospirota bacterium]